MRPLWYVIAFVILSALDAITTWVGADRGLAEANPLIAARLSLPALFFGGYAVFTLLGVLLLVVVFRLSRFISPLRYFPPIFVLLKALPVFSNIMLLLGT